MRKINEKKVIRKQLIKNMFLNFIIFTAILLIFDFMIYNQVTNSLYQEIDTQLQNSSQMIEEPREDIEKPEMLDNNRPRDNEEDEINPRLIIVRRDENGEIENLETLGNLSNYESQIKFDASNLNSIYNIQINGEYSYRCINFKITENDEEVYIQVLANVDGEAGTLENMINILAIGTIILVVVSILVSYLLSKKAMKPVIEAYKKQTEFVQNASHELRTPLSIIQAKQELLLTQPDKKIIEKSEEINLTLRETRRLTKMIKELMDLARADEEKIELIKEDVDINNLVEEVVEPYMDLVKIQEKTIELDLKYNKILKVNKNKITELLIIVLDNAIKYTDKGDTIKIKTYLKEGKCNIEIQDTGVGIKESSIKYIFDRFYREDEARARKKGGNGLGLSIAKMIVNLHGGTINAYHNEPKGTVIKIKL